jgi:hypothetical protein
MCSSSKALESRARRILEAVHDIQLAPEKYARVLPVNTSLDEVEQDWGDRLSLDRAVLRLVHEDAKVFTESVREVWRCSPRPSELRR